MSGLLLKDFYLMRKYCRGYAVIVAVFIMVSCIGDTNAFLLFYPCVLSGVIPITLLSYDEREKWSLYEGTMPVTRAQVVSGKYCISLLVGGCVAVLMSAAQFAARGVGKEYLQVLVLMVLFLLLIPALILPFVFRLGAEKGRVAYVIVIAAATAAAAGVIGARTQDLQLHLQLGAAAEAGLLAAAGIVFVCSWLLSIRIYQKREL